VTITDGQMKAALKVYASYSETYRAKIEGMIRVFDLSAIKIDTSLLLIWQPISIWKLQEMLMMTGE